MPVTDPGAPPVDPVDSPEDPSAVDPVDSPEDPPDDPEGAEHLGDPGKQALDRMKARVKAAEDARKASDARLKALEDAEADRNRTEVEREAEQGRRNAELAATTKANQRLVRAEVRGAAAGKLRNPADALAFIDLASLSVSEDGDTDPEEIDAAIAKLLEDRPYLAADGGKAGPFVRNDTANTKTREAAGPKQLTREDLKKMSSSQIMEAQSKGQLERLLKGA